MAELANPEPIIHPLVVTVTPTYNGAAFLAEAMHSVQQQTYPNLIHLILDNGSTDETPKIIESFKDGQVPLKAHRNEAVLDQRLNWNRAFELVPENARYIRLLCDDDTIVPTSIEKMVALAESDREIGVVGCLQNCIGDVSDFRWPSDQTVYDGQEALCRALSDEGTIMPIHLLLRKSLADQRRPLFDDYMEGAFDMDTVFDLLTRSKFGFVHEPLGFTRVHENTVTNRLFKDNASWTRDALDLLLKYGEFAFGSDYNEELRRFRRYYLRRIIRWSRAGMPSEHLSIHYDALRRADWSMSPFLIGDAVLNWIAVKLGLDHPWRGYPGWQ
ncbi:MAG: glycosyltransferase family A protein [Pseudomonadota bacterium]